MSQEHLETRLEQITYLLSHLHGEITALEESYSQVLLVLQKFESVCDRDDLSGLLRRGAFFQKWRTLLDECTKVHEECGVMMLDIDFFKRINDTHGHAAGDEVIRQVSALLKRFESPRCVVGRIGGEEFALAVRGSEGEVRALAEMIRQEVERTHGPVSCTISVGTATSKAAEVKPELLLQAADEALYRSKQNGRNRVTAA